MLKSTRERKPKGGIQHENVQDRRIELLLSGRAGIDLNTTKAGCTFADIPAFTNP